MKYYIVYILESERLKNHFYVGYTENMLTRLNNHNSGKTASTSKYKPWEIRTLIKFTDTRTARDFERYLKSGSGRAFSKRHF